MATTPEMRKRQRSPFRRETLDAVYYANLVVYMAGALVFFRRGMRFLNGHLERADTRHPNSVLVRSLRDARNFLRGHVLNALGRVPGAGQLLGAPGQALGAQAPQQPAPQAQAGPGLPFQSEADIPGPFGQVPGLVDYLVCYMHVHGILEPVCPSKTYIHSAKGIP